MEKTLQHSLGAASESPALSTRVQATAMRAVADLEQLAALALSGGGDSLSISLRVQTDLILNIGEPSAQMLAGYETLAKAALPLVDARTADIVTGKLALWSHAPPSLRALVAQTAPAVAPMMAALDLATGDAELIQIAEAGNIDALTALAARPPAALSVPVLQSLARRAQSDVWLADTLLSRHDLPPLAMLPLFARVETYRRNRVFETVDRHLAIAPIPIVRRAVPETVTTFTSIAHGFDDGTRLILAQLAGGSQRLNAALAHDETRVLTTFSLVSAGFDNDQVIRVLLVIGDEVSRSVQSIFALADMLRDVRPETARFIASAMSGDPMSAVMERKSAIHVPVADPSATPVRQGATIAPPVRRGADWGGLLPTHANSKKTG